MTGSQRGSGTMVPEFDQPEESRRESEEGDLRAGLVLNLGRALLKLGSPAHRLEAAMEIMATRLGLSGQFFSTPTALIASLGDGKRQQTYLVRVDPGSADLGRLADLTDVMEGLSADRLTPEEADRQVTEIDQRKNPFDTVRRIIGTGLVGTGGAGLLGGGLREMLLGGSLGLALALVVALIGSAFSASRLINPLSAAVATFLGMLWCGLDAQTALMPAVIGGIIVLLPGMDLTVATRELATGHLVSGSSRLASAVLTFVLLAFGLSIGGYLGMMVVDEMPQWYRDERPWAVIALAVPVAACGFTLLYRAHWRDTVWILLACILAYSGATLGNWIQGAYLAPFTGGLAVGIAGNLYARLTFRPASTINLPALVLLVPGSIGLTAMAVLLGADIVAGVETAFRAIMTAVALTTGMILAGVVVQPRSAL